MNHIVRDYLIPRFGQEIAEDVKPLDIQRWLKSLQRTKDGLDDGRARSRCYAAGLQDRHPARAGFRKPVLSRSRRAARPTTGPSSHPGPDATRSCGPRLPRFTAFWSSPVAYRSRASELVRFAGRISAVDEGRIRVSKRWARGKDGATKTEGSDGYVPLHPRLARHLAAWHRRTPYGKETDFVFPSIQGERAKCRCLQRGYSSRTICGRQQKAPGCGFLTDAVSGFITSATTLPTGW